MPSKRKPIEINLPAVKNGRELLPVTAYVQPDELDAYREGIMRGTLTLGQFFNAQWGYGVIAYMDAHESVWTRIFPAPAIPQAPKQHETVEEAVRHAYTVTFGREL